MKRMTIGLLAVAAAIAFGDVAAGGPDSALAGGGLKVFLESTIELDEAAGTITLPLFRGTHDGEDVFYIITESSNRDDAEARGINWAPKLANAIGTVAVQSVTAPGGVVAFEGTVDFSLARVVVPGPTGFPPDVAEPGSTGDADYSPLITMGDGIVLNAPHVVRSDQTDFHDSVVSIDFAAMEVTLELVAGFYHGKDILYISTDVSDPVVAALEASTFAPNLNAAPGLASNDPDTSARAGIVPFVNGQTGEGNPERQGLQSALLDGLSPLNVTEEHPNNRGKIPLYSPLWDVHPAVWTDDAIATGQRRRLDHHDDIAEAVEDGLLVSGGAGPENPVFGGLRAAGFIVNCPIMALD